jgi:hypothetical protein
MKCFLEREIMDGRKVSLMVILVSLVCFTGCQRECVTKSDSFSFPIIVSSETDRVCHDDGTLNVREKGGACILASWDNDRTYNADGELIRYNDRSGIWPFYSIRASKTESRKKSSGTILLFYSFDNEKHI